MLIYTTNSLQLYDKLSTHKKKIDEILLSFIQFKPQYQHRCYVHRDNNTDHHVNISVRFELTDAHLTKEYRWFFKMTIIELGFWWTPQIRSIHTVNGIEYTMKTGSKIAKMPHPLEHFIYVDVASTKTKHRE